MQHDPTYIFDFDSTIINCESLDELARFTLANTPNKQAIIAQLEELTAAGMAGTMAFDESLRKRLQLFKATKADVLELTAYLQSCVTPSLLTYIDWMTEQRNQIYVISGGFEEYIKPIATSIGLLANHVYANRFTYDKSDNITGYDDSRLTSRAGGKVAQVRALALPHPIIVIGDGYTDYEIKAAGEAEQFWAFTEHIHRPAITVHADRLLHSFNDLPIQ
jgi:D-3-phosphoglycerate dehydrogenase